MRNLGRIFAAALAIALAPTCSKDKDLSVESYKRSCTADTDCMLIEVGDPCTCACSFGAINKSDAPRYSVDRSDRDCQGGCESNIHCTDCKKPAVYCAQNLCAVLADEPKDAGVEVRSDASVDAGDAEALVGTSCAKDADCKSALLGCSGTRRCAFRCAAGSTCKGGGPCLAEGTCQLCGDGVCDTLERATPALCPGDCSSTKLRKVETTVKNPTSGVLLAATFYLPEDASAQKRYPGVVLVPGGSGDGSGFEKSGLCASLVAKGIIALTFDLDGRGTSGGSEDFCGHLHQDGVNAMIDALATRPEVTAEKVGVYSSSFGVTCASGALSRHASSTKAKFLVDWEGPANRADTGHCDASNTGHITHDCSDELWWKEREAAVLIKAMKLPYLRLQTAKDHAQPDNKHAILMIKSATGTSFGGDGQSPWTLCNDETLNSPNTVYTEANPPKWLAETAGDREVESILLMIGKL